MQIELLWSALEADARSRNFDNGGWLLRLVQPIPECTLSIGVDLKKQRRALLLRTSQSLIPPRRLWPSINDLELFAVVLGANTYFAVSLENSRYHGVFTVFAETLFLKLSTDVTPEAQLTIFLAKIAAWQNFLSASLPILGADAQVHLLGELIFLREYLLPVLGITSVNAWQKSRSQDQTFQFERGSIEVKTRLTRETDTVRIASLRQLHTVPGSMLFLHAILLDESREETGVTLPNIVSSLRMHFECDPTASQHFENGLTHCDYFDHCSAGYSKQAYVVSYQTTFHVQPGFPRLTEKEAPTGILDASYILDLAQCHSFIVNETDFKNFLTCVSSTSKQP